VQFLPRRDRTIFRSVVCLFILLALSFPLWMPLQVPIWVTEIGSDKLAHSVYSLLIGFGAAAFWKVLGGRTRWLLPAVALALAGCEFAQIWMPMRSFEWVEVLINALGGMLGASAAGASGHLIAAAIRHRLAADAHALANPLNSSLQHPASNL
jgi:hypothetical protein